MIALATCPGGMMLHNGQEWGQYEDIWEDDSNASPADARVQARPLLWAQESDSIGQTLQARYSFLLTLRDQHPGLRTPNFYPTIMINSGPPFLRMDTESTNRCRLPSTNAGATTTGVTWSDSL